MSPTLANVFFHPLVALLDRSMCGAQVLGCHVPAVCYADDLMLLSTNAKKLGCLLRIVENFASFWRLDFVNVEPSKTKSHCIVFGDELLSVAPTWCLSGQQLAVRKVTEHLGVVMSCDLGGSRHAQHRIRRARGAFYGLTPAGMLSTNLAPLDKAFLWKTVVLPTLTFGCETAALSSFDVGSLDSLQSRCLKAALGLSKYAHHSALLVALGIPRIHEELRRAAVFGLTRIFRGGDHRLSQVMTSWLAMLATEPQQLSGSFLGFVYRLLNCSFEDVLGVAAGRVNADVIHAPIAPDGVIDSLRYLLCTEQSVLSRRLVRLICA